MEVSLFFSFKEASEQLLSGASASVENFETLRLL